MFVFENVMGILSANNGTTWRNLIKYLKRVDMKLNGRNKTRRTWCPSNRKRIIIVGWLKGSGIVYLRI
jgi:DNA (cytosine-5)-methyltransferase 1